MRLFASKRLKERRVSLLEVLTAQAFSLSYRYGVWSMYWGFFSTFRPSYRTVLNYQIAKTLLDDFRVLARLSGAKCARHSATELGDRLDRELHPYNGVHLHIPVKNLSNPLACYPRHTVSEDLIWSPVAGPEFVPQGVR